MKTFSHSQEEEEEGYNNIITRYVAQIVYGVERLENVCTAVMAAIKHGTCYIFFSMLKCHYTCVLLIFSQLCNDDEVNDNDDDDDNDDHLCVSIGGAQPSPQHND